MTLAIITDLEADIFSLFAKAKTEVAAIEPEIVAWAKNFLAGITPVIKQAATDAVLAAVTVPGTGLTRAAAAFAAASADLLSKGIPVAENNLKAAIQIAYEALPASVTSNPAAAAVVSAADNAVTAEAAKITGTAAASTAQAS